ncbi:MAG: DEAD/DEAH box helicase [Cyanobacteriota bacterium]
MTSFNLLSEKIQRLISNDLKWNKLTDIQEISIPHILDGKNAIILAQTAGGKTESVFFPALSIIDKEKIAGISILYISPIKALLNNQEGRLKKISNSIYQDAFNWHGDISKSKKDKFYKNPTSVLMITPESLEVILLSQSYDKDYLFFNLRFIIIDEIHSFAEGDRGSHLISVIERLQTYSKYDIQRLGLSATVGNPETIGKWLKGGSKRKGVVLNPEIKSKNRIFNVSYYLSDEYLKENVYQNFFHKKILFFVNGRKEAEKIHSLLKPSMENIFVHHSSMDKSFRNKAEESFKIRSEPSCIVCTSTMELGIDIGDLDSVLQLNEPKSVSSFLQRIGRTGRREGKNPEMSFYISNTESFVKTLAVRELSKKNKVESVIVSQRAYHIYLHQIIALLIEDFRKEKEVLFNILAQVYCFSGISFLKYEKLLEHLKNNNIIEINDRNIISIGVKGEKTFFSRNYQTMYSVFQTLEEFTVKFNNKDIGTLQSWFIFTSGNKLDFYLSGQSWSVFEIDEKNKILYVEKTNKADLPNWSGQTSLVSFDMCQEYLSILSGEKEILDLEEKEKNILDSIIKEEKNREDYQKANEIIITKKDGKIRIITFCGNRVNYTIALMLKHFLGFENFSITEFQISFIIKKEVSDILELINKIKKNGNFYFSEENIQRYSKYFPEIEYSKFQSFILDDLSKEYLSDVLLDIKKAREVIESFFIKTKN